MTDFMDELRAKADRERIEAWDRWYATLPDELKRKLSVHDFRRLGECFRVAFNIPKVVPPEEWITRVSLGPLD
jgi:hypothetical protein